MRVDGKIEQRRCRTGAGRNVILTGGYMKQATIQITFEEEKRALRRYIASAIRRWKRSCKRQPSDSMKRSFQLPCRSTSAIASRMNLCANRKEIGGAGMSAGGLSYHGGLRGSLSAKRIRHGVFSLPDGSMIISSRDSACQRGVSLKRRTTAKRSAARLSMRWQSTAWRTPARSADCLS